MSTSPLALAQPDEDFVDLGTLVLRNQEDATGPVDGDRNPPTTTGSKVPLRLNEIPQSVLVLGREDLDRFNATRVSEALRYTAGVTTDVFGNDTDYDWLRIRGFQADQTGIYLDNAQNLAFAFGSFYIDPYTLERIEVLRGPSSALYGGSNPGGIVNYVSKRPGERVRELTFGINDATAAWVELDYGDALENGSAYRVTGRIEGGDKYDQFNNGVRGTLAPSLKFATVGGTEVTLLANLHIADEQHNGSTFLPYFGTVEPTDEYGVIDPDVNFSDPDWDVYERNQLSLSSIIERSFDNGVTFTGIGRVGFASVEERYYYPNGYPPGFPASPTPTDPDGTLNLVAFEHDTEVRTAQVDLRFYGEVDAGAVTHDLLFGLDARRYELDETQAAGGTTTLPVDPVAPGEPTLFPPYRDGITEQEQVGLYAQDQINWGQGWIATLNLRHDWVESDQSVRSGFGSAFSRSDDETSWRAALAYEAESGLTPYVSVSSSFDARILSEADGVTEPETAEQIEAGLKWAPEDDNFSITASAYQINRENVVVGTFAPFNQLGEVRSRGVELEGVYDFQNGLTLAGAASLIDQEVTEDQNPDLIGTTPTLVPEREISARMDYAFADGLDGLTLGAGVRHRGTSFADEANTLEVPSSTIYDLYGGYAFNEFISANLVVWNVSDEVYVTGCQSVFVCSYGSGREVSLTLTSRW
ncbi:TonB-dependent siderophore receptor [Cognatiyoonia sp. IB215182]|uniref:TonB-dependent siderophore receptor n=1 Tax=Cognatiyoonia sp. IB215182 TaxID=3097353 RepID=UPI002A0C976C|nr:TonB-dependent siderophore receptor [Cognatiyoonia sp. IB215182]MDX8354767.1 TonB-dependent siderophore receptor [Cognatiyoonia sp. IB215182]